MSRVRVLPWLISGVVVLALCASLVLEALNGWRSDLLMIVVGSVAVLSTSFVGLVVATHRPSNSIGWILLASGLYLSLSALSGSYAIQALPGDPNSLPAADWAAAFSDRTWPLVFAGVTAIAFVFPTGRVGSDRRRGARLTAWAFVLLTLAAIFSYDGFSAPLQGVENPIPQIPAGLVDAFLVVGLAGTFAGMVMAALALRGRYRDATGIERLQLRWLSLAAAMVPPVIAICLLEGLITGDDGPATGFALVFALSAFPIAIGFAVTRYRLYEIDRVINRGLVYGSLTVLLGAAFAIISIAGGVVLGAGSTIPTAVATLIVILTFNPLRRRLQVTVDRRFNRARYEGLRRVGRFLAELRSGQASPENAEQTLAEALADPQLRLLYWISPEAPFVDAAGRPRSGDPGRGRVSTPVARGALRLGTVIHDESVSAQPDLLVSVIEAAGLAIEIGRLRVEVRMRLAEVEESRARIVTAGIEERRRLERDLHDGAQQRLVSIGLDLRHVQLQITDDREARDALDGVVAELAAAIRELRELARGVRPPALDHGLAAALEQLGSRASLPTTVEAVSDRVDENIEAAAYFVASEALTNAAKHSGACSASIKTDRRRGKLVVSVRDDGIGGAAPEGGSGLEGIADRLAALGGSLTLSSPAGGGTTVFAELPCE